MIFDKCFDTQQKFEELRRGLVTRDRPLHINLSSELSLYL